MKTSASLKALLVQLASQAGLPSLKDSGPLLPDGWVALTRFSSTGMGSVTAVQGYLSVGPINEDGDLAVALSLGITWSAFYKNNIQGFPEPKNDLKPLSSRIMGKSMPAAMVLSVFADAYLNAQTDIWDSLEFLEEQYQDLPFFITGMGLGAPMAQICQLDFKEGNTGPTKQDPPKKLAECYVFSAPGFTNEDFKGFYNSLIANKKMPAQYCVWAASQSIKADFFPMDEGYLQVGELQYIDGITLPKYDVPWWERSDVFYLQQLGGEPFKNPVIPVSFSNIPTGFSRELAYTLSLLTAVTYQMTQHPNSTVKIDIAPYQLYKTFGDGTTYAAIFESPESIVLAFRGTISFKEFYTFNCLSVFTPVSFILDSSAEVHAGAGAIYNLPITGTPDTTLSAVLIAELKNKAKNKKLYITGHDIGGAVAGLAATDYALNNYGFKVTSLYTFGSTLFSNIIYKNYFEDSTGANSYQLSRIKDTLSNAIIPLGFFSLMNQITVNGRLETEESTYHSLRGYIELLNPYDHSKSAQDSEIEKLQP